MTNKQRILSAALGSVLTLGAVGAYVGISRYNEPPQDFPQTERQRFRGNRQSKIYHWKGCPNFDDIAERNRVSFETAEDAKKAGYRPAQNCP